MGLRNVFGWPNKKNDKEQENYEEEREVGRAQKHWACDFMFGRRPITQLVMIFVRVQTELGFVRSLAITAPPLIFFVLFVSLKRSFGFLSHA